MQHNPQNREDPPFPYVPTKNFKMKKRENFKKNTKDSDEGQKMAYIASNSFTLSSPPLVHSPSLLARTNRTNVINPKSLLSLC